MCTPTFPIGIFFVSSAPSLYVFDLAQRLTSLIGKYRYYGFLDRRDDLGKVSSCRKKQSEFLSLNAIDKALQNSLCRCSGDQMLFQNSWRPATLWYFDENNLYGRWATKRLVQNKRTENYNVKPTPGFCNLKTTSGRSSFSSPTQRFAWFKRGTIWTYGGGEMGVGLPLHPQSHRKLY